MRVALEQRVEDHYRQAGLLQSVLDHAAQRASEEGLPQQPLTADALAVADEFHTGGAQATDELLDRLSLSAASRVLDAGCGIGGTARRVAQRFDCQVTGIDLTADYIRVATQLTEKQNLLSQCSFQTGSVLDLPFTAASFDVCLSLHVAMNIRQRAAFYDQINRVLAADGVFASYDIVCSGATGELRFPLPWSASSDTSFLSTVEQTERLLGEAGFEMVLSVGRSFSAPPAPTAAGSDTPKSANVLLGDQAAEKVANHRLALQSGLIAAHTFVARKVV
ncbi:MAG: class I SAM-dependent methyltransferase [Planctomycetaceae bacterium]|nr:class I SAM-dependent methyltransferase [Planctomycetaceae bacterium]